MAAFKHRGERSLVNGTGPLRRLSALLLLVAIGSLSSCSQPDGELLTGAGERQAFSFADWRGEWLLVNYWAEWCAPCRREIPELNALNGDPAVQVVGVNFDGISAEALPDLVAKMGIQFPTLLNDPGPRFAQERPRILPITLVIDPEGALVSRLQGPQTVESLRAALNH